jgi:DNA topoisomerase-1
MQKENLGTKATRAGVIQTLYDRKYITDEIIAVTDVGFEVVDILQRYCPTVLSSALTAELEEKMNAIQEQKETKQHVVSEAIEILKTATTKLKENEAAIGKQLSQALAESKLEGRTVGACPTCTCKTAFPLPQRGVVKPLRAACKGCGYPMVCVWLRGRRSWTLCLNPDCSLKKGGSENR